MADKEPLSSLLSLRAPWYISRIDVDVASEEVHVTIDHHPSKLPCASYGKDCQVKDHSDVRVIRPISCYPPVGRRRSQYHRLLGRPDQIP